MRPLLTAFLVATAACAADEEPAAAGVVQGTVLDAAGRPLAGVKITVEHTVFHASYVHGRTDAAGRYRVEVPNGGWKAHAQLERALDGRPALFDLDPENPDAFTGTEGAVRNFTWRISGPRPDLAGGHYGAQLTVYGDFFDPSVQPRDLEVTLAPAGALVDGSEGRAITARPVESRDQIDDIPVGRYRVKVRHATRGAMLVRVRNAGDYAEEPTVTFTAPTGSTRFALEIEVMAR